MLQKDFMIVDDRMILCQMKFFADKSGAHGKHSPVLTLCYSSVLLREEMLEL